jgi:DHA2 family methylenomycin A resistance protein-like MFS transporter
VEAAGLAAAGVGAGFFSTSRYLGSIAGSALLAGLLGAGGFAAVFLLIVAAALLSALAGLGLRDHA